MLGLQERDGSNTRLNHTYKHQARISYQRLCEVTNPTLQAPLCRQTLMTTTDETVTGLITSTNCILQVSPCKGASHERHRADHDLTVERIAGKRNKQVGRAAARSEAGASRGKAA